MFVFGSLSTSCSLPDIEVCVMFIVIAFSTLQRLFCPIEYCTYLLLEAGTINCTIQSAHVRVIAYVRVDIQ